MKRKLILNEIKKIIASAEELQTSIALGDITETYLVYDDLGYDSMALMTLAYELQETHEHIDEMAINNWKTISDVINDVLQTKTKTEE